MPLLAEASRPMFARDGVVVSADGALLVDIRHQLIRLSGAGTTVIARLLPLMDGTRTIADLERTLPDVPPDHVRRAVALLKQHALVEIPNADQRSAATSDDLQPFLRRFAAHGETGAEAIDRLAQLTLAIVVDDPASEPAIELDGLLKAGGVGHVDRVAASSLLSKGGATIDINC